MTLAVCHKSLCSILSPCDVYLWTLLHPTCTYEICSYSSVMLVIHHKSLCSVLSLSNMYLRDPLASDLWDPMAYMSHVLVRPFFISIQHAGPDGLHVMCTYGTIRPMGPDGSRVTCTYGTFLHLHLTCGTR